LRSIGDVQPKDAASIEDVGQYAESHRKDSLEVYVCMPQLDLDSLLIVLVEELPLQLREMPPATMANSTRSRPPSPNPSLKELHKQCFTPLE
jgi:hypothetical protein